MSNALTPTPEQQGWIDKFVGTNLRGGIMGAGMGVGKTLMAAEISRLRSAERVLIIAPESTFDSWASTVYWQTGRKLKRCANNALTFSFTPNPNERDVTESVKITSAQSKSNLAACQAGEQGWFFVTRELFTLQTWTKVTVKRDGKEVIDPKTKKPKTRAQRKDVWSNKKPFDIAILDENQRFAKKGNRGQQSWRALGAEFRVPMSADWFGSELSGMYTVADDLWGSEGVGGLNRSAWEDEFLTSEYDHFSYNKKKITGEQIPGLFAATLPLYVTAPPSVKIPEPEYRHVTLSRQERELYDKLENDFVAMVDDEVLAVEIPLVLRIRLRELSLGMFEVARTGEIGEDGIEKVTVNFPAGARSSKLDEIKSILSDYPGEKFAIFTHSAKWAQWAANELPNAEAWTGQTSKAERSRIKSDWVDGDLRIVVAHPGTMGTGTDGLQRSISNVIFASRVDKADDNIQAIGRFARTGQRNQVNVWDIEARDTFDSGQLRAVRDRIARNDGAKGWG